jgi:hypothetical protein
VTLMRKTHKPTNSVKDLDAHTASGVRAIACDMSPNIRDVFGREGMKTKSLRHGSFPLQDFIFLLAKARKEGFAVDGLHPSAFQIVIAAVEHFPHLRKRGDISGQGILDQPLRRKSGFHDPLIYLGLQLGRQLNFHGFRVA